MFSIFTILLAFSSTIELATTLPHDIEKGGTKSLGDVSCVASRQPLRQPPVPLACEVLFDYLQEEYVDFGVMEWGKKAPPSRRFPFNFPNSRCQIQIDSKDKAATDKFTVAALRDLFFNIFYDCLLQRQPPPEGTFWVGGFQAFTGQGAFTLYLKVAMIFDDHLAESVPPKNGTTLSLSNNTLDLQPLDLSTS